MRFGGEGSLATAELDPEAPGLGPWLLLKDSSSRCLLLELVAGDCAGSCVGTGSLDGRRALGFGWALTTVGLGAWGDDAAWVGVGALATGVEAEGAGGGVGEEAAAAEGPLCIGTPFLMGGG